MQTSSLPSVVKQLRFILAPLAAGAMIGVLAGLGAVVLGRLMMSGDSEKQEVLAFVGFTLLFSLAGLVETVKNFLAWQRFRKSQRDQEQNSRSDS
jgi:hypothetical protein